MLKDPRVNDVIVRELPQLSQKYFTKKLKT